MCAAFDAHGIPKLTSKLFLAWSSTKIKGELAGFVQMQQGCTQIGAQSPDSHRELVPGSLEAGPIPGYGAIEVGEHLFFHRKNGRHDCGKIKFTMLWQQKGSAWDVARFVSYGHCSLADLPH